MTGYVEVIVTVGGTVVDTDQFFDGGEIEREQFCAGVEAVGKAVLPTVTVVHESQYHDHYWADHSDDVPAVTCDCWRRFGPTRWSNTGGTTYPCRTSVTVAKS